MRSVLYAAHRIIIWIIKRSPIFPRVLFTAYNAMLRVMRAEYTGSTYFGASIKCRLTDVIPRRIFHFGYWEPNNSALIASNLHPGDVFVDVGANIGYYTLLGARRVGDEGRVVAIEALPQIFGLLKENTEANGVRNVRLVNVAVSDRAGDLVIYGAPPGNRGMSSTASAGDWSVEAVVPAAPLDEILTPEELGRVRLVKVDIEGGELPVLERFVDTLGRYPHDIQLLVEIAPLFPDRVSSVFRRLIDAGFHAYALENDYSLKSYLRWRRPCAPKPIDCLPGHQIDVLFRRAEIAAT